jgi:hypothetical protein
MSELLLAVSCERGARLSEEWDKTSWENRTKVTHSVSRRLAFLVRRCTDCCCISGTAAVMVQRNLGSTAGIYRISGARQKRPGLACTREVELGRCACVRDLEEECIAACMLQW